MAHNIQNAAQVQTKQGITRPEWDRVHLALPLLVVYARCPRLTPCLIHPPSPHGSSFSNCTLPVLLAPEFPFNMGEFFARAVSAVHGLALGEPSALLVFLIAMRDPLPSSMP